MFGSYQFYLVATQQGTLPTLVSYSFWAYSVSFVASSRTTQILLVALFLAHVADQTISKQQQPPGCFSCSSFQQLRRRVECVEMCRAQVQTIARGADAEPRGKFTDGSRFPAPVFPGCGRWRNSYRTQDSQHNCGTSARFSFDVSKSQSDPQRLLKIQHLQFPPS